MGRELRIHYGCEPLPMLTSSLHKPPPTRIDRTYEDAGGHMEELERTDSATPYLVMDIFTISQARAPATPGG